MTRVAQRATAAFGAALLPPEHGGPTPAQLIGQVDRYVAQLPTATRVAVRGGLLSLAAAGYLTRGRSLTRLAPDARAAVLHQVASLGAEPGAAVAGLKALVLLAHGADSYLDELLSRAQDHDPARADAALTIIPADEASAVITADAVVVGSGAGGAMAARTLARAGFDTVVVEEGRRWSVDEFRNRHPIDRYAGLYRDGGTTIALGRPSIVVPIGRAVGGSTAVNSGTCYRPPVAVQQRWHNEYGLTLADPARLAGHLDEVERTLQVAPVPLDIMGRNGNLLLDGAAALGWHAAPIPRNAPGCDACCQCALGCPMNAKYGVHLNALPQACAAGARIISPAHTERILSEHGYARGVRAHRPDGTAIDIRAPTVIAAAGATQTPHLLWRSGLGKHPQLGRNLAIHPAAALAGRFDHDVHAWRGVLQSAAVEQLHTDHGVLIEATATPPGMGSMAYPGYGRQLVEWLDQAHHIATFGAMITDTGRIIRAPHHQTMLRYRLTRPDAAKITIAIEAMGQLLFAAGATELLTGLPTEPTVTSLPPLRQALARTNPKTLHLAAFHPTGTAAGGANEQRCPVDPTGRLRGINGVWVTDASILPSCPEVNPQISIMALAHAAAENITTTR